MNPFLIPYALALAFGMQMPEPSGGIDTATVTGLPGEVPDAMPGEAADAMPGEAVAEGAGIVAEPVTLGISDLANREPEPQVPTGQYTTAIEVKPILGMTKQSWAAVRLYEGNDLIYFSHLLAWRCGLWGIRYGVNGAAATNEVVLEPCHEGTAQPNAMTDPVGYPIYVTLPGESVQSLYVEVIYDDGTTDFARFERAQILIP